MMNASLSRCGTVSPVKGTYANQGMAVCMSPTPTPGSFVIADATWLSKRHETFEILQSDGTPVGTIMTSGLASGGPTPPGPRVGNHNYAIVGGTGAFLGARGQKGNASSRLNSTIPERT